MSFVTTYSDLLRAHPIYHNTPCRPELRYAPLKGDWLSDGGKAPEQNWNEEERMAFLKKANKDFFWMSTYTDDYTRNIGKAVLVKPRGRPAVKCKKKSKPMAEEHKKKEVGADSAELAAKAEAEALEAARVAALEAAQVAAVEADKVAAVEADKETAAAAARQKANSENELMRAMQDVFERDPKRLVRQPLDTHKRILGYSTPSTYQCGLSTFQEDIGYPGYVFMRDGLVKRPVKGTCHRPTWAIRPLNAVPEGERLIL